MFWTIAKKHEGLIIREYLRQEHAFSRRLIKEIVHNGGDIRVNQLKKTVRYQLQAGDELTVAFPEEEKGTMMVPEHMPLDIVYEDDAILVLNKPSGKAVSPSYNHSSGTIANGVLGYYQENGIPYTVHIVTRLDRDTSGLMLIAKHRWSHSILSASQTRSNISRAYYAVIEGHLQRKKGTIHKPIGRKDGSIIERTVSDTGKAAITHYHVLSESACHSLLKVCLETGRTHQIRVHFSHTGHPLAGDDLYGGSTHYIRRQALHCWYLGFEHPITQETMAFTIDMPDDIKPFSQNV